MTFFASGTAKSLFRFLKRNLADSMQRKIYKRGRTQERLKFSQTE